jgi:drug/metabolite transporter (DMT)-like permease
MCCASLKLKYRSNHRVLDTHCLDLVNNPVLIYLKLLLVALFWGGTFIATRIAAQTFEPFMGASIRYLFACLLLVPLTWKLQPGFWKLTWPQFRKLALLGFSGIFAYNFFFFKGLKLVPASHGALLVALNPIMVLLLSAWRYGERISAAKLAGMSISLMGVILVLSRGKPWDLFNSLEWGDAFMLGCPVTWALYTLAGKEALRTSSPLQATTWASLTGCAMLLLFAGTETAPQVVPGPVWIALAYLGIIGTVLAFVWYYQGVATLGVTKTAIFNNLVPVFALLLSVLILHETVHWYAWVGASLVISGVVIINRL